MKSKRIDIFFFIFSLQNWINRRKIDNIWTLFGMDFFWY